MLITNYVRPEPNPELEAKVRHELREIDGLLDIQWIPDVIPVPKHRTFEGRYALICHWPSSDLRYALIQSGELGNAPYDILGWFSEDMTNGASAAISPDMLETKVRQLLASADNSRQPWRDRMKQSAEHNIELKRKRRAEFLQNEVHDIASHYRNEGLKIQQVAVPTTVTK